MSPLKPPLPPHLPLHYPKSTVKPLTLYAKNVAFNTAVEHLAYGGVRFHSRDPWWIPMPGPQAMVQMQIWSHLS